MNLDKSIDKALKNKKEYLYKMLGKEKVDATILGFLDRLQRQYDTYGEEACKMSDIKWRKEYKK